MALSTGLFHAKGKVDFALHQPLEYNKDNLDIVIAICQQQNSDAPLTDEQKQKITDIKNFLHPYVLKKDLYCDRIDWHYICMYQRYSKKFWSKYRTKLNVYGNPAYTKQIEEALSVEAPS